MIGAFTVLIITETHEEWYVSYIGIIDLVCHLIFSRRAYAKLRINLLESEIQRKMTLYLTWTERVEQWKKLNVNVAIQRFM